MDTKRVAKQIGRSSVLRTLEILAKARLAKINPRVVGVTGSVGKTSTKEAIFTVLSSKMSAHCNKASFNSEFGLPLTILEQESGYSSAGKWVEILAKAAWNLITTPRSYAALVLEMGVDKPGDMKRHVRMVVPEVAVFTNVKAVHMAEGQFPDVEAVFQEKAELVRALKPGGWAILNNDDARVMRVAKETQANVVTFGMKSGSDLRARQVESGPDGLRFILTFEDQSHKVHLPQLLGEHEVYMVLAAIAVGFVMGIGVRDILSALKNIHLPPGRMSKLDGIHGSTILDASYNASPDTVEAALQVLRSFPGRRIAALGSMNELGERSEHAHRQIGRMIPQVADLLVTVGDEARWMAEAALKHGLTEPSVHSFKTSKEAGAFLKNMLRAGDVVLAKGSQNNVRMEYCVQAIMADPSQAKTLLVRQNDYWKSN